MNTTIHSGFISGSRRRARLIGALAALFAFGGVAWATGSEKYPDYGDAAVEALATSWRVAIKGLETELCTGYVIHSGSSGTRDPVNSTPAVPDSKPLGTTRPDGAQETETHVGGDTDEGGVDSFLYVKLVALKASVFCKAILEAEDGATSEWHVRFRGEETLELRNGPFRRAEKYVVTNPWTIGWARRLVDFDALDGEHDEAKSIDQKFEVRCTLIDGKTVKDGASFHHVAPTSLKTTSKAGLKLQVGVKVADGTLGASVEPLFEASAEKTWDTKFDTFTDNSDSALAGTATRTGVVDCPFGQKWDLSTEFDADLSIHDKTDANGDQGSRQELLIDVMNYVSHVTVETCHACGENGPPVPLDPNPRGPRTPTDPSPTGGGAICGGVPPTTGGPAITPGAGEEPGFSGPTTSEPSTGGSPSPASGPVVTPAAGREPGFTGPTPGTGPTPPPPESLNPLVSSDPSTTGGCLLPPLKLPLSPDDAPKPTAPCGEH